MEEECFPEMSGKHEKKRKTGKRAREGKTRPSEKKQERDRERRDRGE